MEIKSVKKSNGINDELTSYLITYKNSNLTSSVPLDEENTDYKKIMKWVEDGNVIEEAD